MDEQQYVLSSYANDDIEMADADDDEEDEDEEEEDYEDGESSASPSRKRKSLEEGGRKRGKRRKVDVSPLHYRKPQSLTTRM